MGCRFRGVWGASFTGIHSFSGNCKKDWKRTGKAAYNLPRFYNSKELCNFSGEPWFHSNQLTSKKNNQIGLFSALGIKLAWFMCLGCCSCVCVCVCVPNTWFHCLHILQLAVSGICGCGSLSNRHGLSPLSSLPVNKIRTSSYLCTHKTCEGFHNQTHSVLLLALPTKARILCLHSL
jgi:hypothetical protein